MNGTMHTAYGSHQSFLLAFLLSVLFVCCQAMTKAPAKVDKFIKTCAWAGAPDQKHPNYHPPQIAVVDCGHGYIGEVVFASWGDPDGECSGALGDDKSFKKGSCNSAKTQQVVTASCVGQHKCMLPGDTASANAMFGVPSPDCGGAPMKIALVISCGAAHWGIAFLITIAVLLVLYLGGGTIYSMRVGGKTWATDKWHILPHANVWFEAGELVLDGFRFAVGKVEEWRTGKVYVSEFVRNREEAAAKQREKLEAAQAIVAASPNSTAALGMATGVYDSDEDEYELWTTDEEDEEEDAGGSVAKIPAIAEEETSDRSAFVDDELIE